ncbi:MAG: hypothetical protein ACLVG9_03160, partial [Eubacteriales bacterium]
IIEVIKMEKHDDLPLGFGMALAQNEQAMTYFANLTEEQKQSVITATHNIQSKQEMHNYVQNLTRQES